MANPQVGIVCTHCSAVSQMYVQMASAQFNCPKCHKKTTVYFRNGAVYETKKG